jgi:hypothetical protein
MVAAVDARATNLKKRVTRTPRFYNDESTQAMTSRST